MSELAGCDVIYAIKPQASAGRAQPPGNYFEVQDFNTETWFNTSFAAEVRGCGRPGETAAGSHTEGYDQARQIFHRDLAATPAPAKPATRRPR